MDLSAKMVQYLMQTNFLIIGLTAIAMVPVDRIEAAAVSTVAVDLPSQCSATADVAMLASRWSPFAGPCDSPSA